MKLHCALSYAQSMRYFLIGQAASNEHRDLMFAWRHALHLHTSCETASLAARHRVNVFLRCFRQLLADHLLCTILSARDRRYSEESAYKQ